MASHADPSRAPVDVTPAQREEFALRQLITELEALSLHTAEQAEGWQPQPPTDTDQRGR